MQGFLSARRRSTRPCGWARFGISALLLISLSGAQWWMLQSVAWTGMLFKYSATSGVLKGVEETFDGEHPCRMCVAIKQSRESESGQPATLAPVQKSADLLGLPPDSDVHIERPCLPAPTHVLSSSGGLKSPPPLPPPRISPA